MSCEQCKSLVDSYNLDNPTKQKEYGCVSCEMPKPLPANFEALHLLRVYGNTMSNSMGGLTLSEIILACRLESIQPTTHLVNKIIIYYQELTKKDDNGNQ
jgi:hypothetical protein